MKNIRPSATWFFHFNLKPLFLSFLSVILTVQDPYQYSQYGSGSRGAISIRIKWIRFRNTDNIKLLRIFAITSVLDPDWIRIGSGPWIRIRIRIQGSGSESRGKKVRRYSTKSYDTENTDYWVYEKHCARLQNSTCTTPRIKVKIDQVRTFQTKKSI